MSQNKDIHTFYKMLMEKYKFYQDVLTPFMQIRTKNEEEIKQIYQNLKTTFLDTNIYSPINVYNLINNMYLYNNRYLASYWSIFKMIYEDYHIKPDSNFDNALKYFFYKEYNLNIRAHDKKLFKKYEIENYSLEVHPENTVYSAIMKDDLQSFISFIQNSNFDKNKTLRSDLYPNATGFEQYSLLEICSYQGAVKCFKYLRSEYNMQITPTCLNFSFLSGVPEIMGECLKFQTPNDESMFFVIVSHNTDFLTFLINQYHLELNIFPCAAWANLYAYLIYLDMTKN